MKLSEICMLFLNKYSNLFSVHFIIYLQAVQSIIASYNIHGSPKNIKDILFEINNRSKHSGNNLS